MRLILRLKDWLIAVFLRSISHCEFYDFSSPGFQFNHPIHSYFISSFMINLRLSCPTVIPILIFPLALKTNFRHTINFNGICHCKRSWLKTGSYRLYWLINKCFYYMSNVIFKDLFMLWTAVCRQEKAKTHSKLNSRSQHRHREPQGLNT